MVTKLRPFSMMLSAKKHKQLPFKIIHLHEKTQWLPAEVILFDAQCKEHKGLPLEVMFLLLRAGAAQQQVSQDADQSHEVGIFLLDTASKSGKTTVTNVSHIARLVTRQISSDHCQPHIKSQV